MSNTQQLADIAASIFTSVDRYVRTTPASEPYRQVHVPSGHVGRVRCGSWARGDTDSIVIGDDTCYLCGDLGALLVTTTDTGIHVSAVDGVTVLPGVWYGYDGCAHAALVNN